jgi:Domain of unknown function (DUF3859)
MRMLLLVLGLLAAAESRAAAQTPTVAEPAATISSVTVTNAGAYSAVSTSVPAQAGQESPTRTIGTEANWHFVSDSTDVDGKVGTRFGIEFRIDGAPDGDNVTLYLVLEFPPQGIRNPNTGETLHTASIAFPAMKIGALCLVGYGFDNAWEIVPGPWKMRVVYRERILIERSFTVSKAE